MTNEQINSAIAEACEYKPIIISRDMTGTPFPGWDEPPNYCNDLNAMRDAWLSLSEEDKFVFDKELQRIILRAKDGQYWLTNATALQRAEAFLKTIEKWKEDQ